MTHQRFVVSSTNLYTFAKSTQQGFLVDFFSFLHRLNKRDFTGEFCSSTSITDGNKNLLKPFSFLQQTPPHFFLLQITMTFSRLKIFSIICTFAQSKAKKMWNLQIKFLNFSCSKKLVKPKKILQLNSKLHLQKNNFALLFNIFLKSVIRRFDDSCERDTKYQQQKRDFHFLVHMDYIYHVTDHCGSLGKSHQNFRKVCRSRKLESRERIGETRRKIMFVSSSHTD